MRFGKYTVDGLIGEGGFGRVYRGHDADLRRAVAIKVCTWTDTDMVARFLREARIAASLQHPNIVTIYDFGEEDGASYVAQELLPGEDLSVVISDRRPLGVRIKLNYLRQVALGLQHAHAQGVVHRDIKPSNLRVLPDGTIRIMDFGIAKVLDTTRQLTQVGTALGTAGYLPPEQLLGEPLDHRGDIFAFGVVAYELLTMRKPFAAESMSGVLYAIAHTDPPAIDDLTDDCPPAVAVCVEKCLQKDPAQRYQSFEEVLQALDSMSAVQSNPTPTPIPVAGAGATAAFGKEAIRAGAREPSATPEEAHDQARYPHRRRLRPSWAAWGGLATVAVMIALFGIINLTQRGQGAPSALTPPPGSEPPVTAPIENPTTPEENEEPLADPSLEAPSSAAVQPSPPGGPTNTEDGESASSLAEEASPTLVGNRLVVVLYGEQESGVGASELAMTRELADRGLEPLTATDLAFLHRDDPAVTAAVAGDFGALAAIGARAGADVLVVGSLSSGAAASVGGFYTGSAELNVTAYQISTGRSLGSERYRVGAGGVPGKLANDEASARSDAAAAVGREAAVMTARLLANR